MPLQPSANTERLAGVYELRERREDCCRALFGAVEQGGQPLWDIPREITGTTGATATAAARRLARRLLLCGWVTIVEIPEFERDLDREEALAVLGRSETWTPPGRMFSMIATDSGLDAYWKHADRRPHHRVGFNF